MEKKSIKKNYLYNLTYQILTVILPIITTPYVSRTLGAEKIGIYSYAISIVTYFCLFGSLGVSMYGQREIAYAGDNIKKRKKVFIELVVLRFVSMIIAAIIYYITVVNGSEYEVYCKILIIYLLANAFDISWFFQGMEEFKKTVTRNIVVRLLSITCIFIFVNKPEDLTKYLLIYSLADFLGNLSLWLYLPRYFKNIPIKNINVRRHLWPVILLFIPQIAMKIYNIVDKTMLGALIQDKAELGNYEQAYRIINVLFTFIYSFGAVMVPRMASIFASGDKQKLKSYINKSLKYVLFLAFPVMFGIIAVSKEFIPIFLGDEYDRAIMVLKVLSPMILLSGITNVIGTQYLLPTKKQRKYTVSIVIGLIVNVILNFIFIKIGKATGAAIATIISQVIVVWVQLYYVKNIINIKTVVRLGYNYIISSINMYIICVLIGLILNQSDIAELVIKVFAGAGTYLIMLILLKDESIELIKEYVNKFRYKMM